MCTASDYKCRNFEKGFKKVVLKKELQNSIVYLNLSNIDRESFLNEFNNKYNYKYKLTSNYPAIVMFEDGKVINLVQGNDKDALTVEEAKQFIEINKLGE